MSHPLDVDRTATITTSDRVTRTNVRIDHLDMVETTRHETSTKGYTGFRN